jgi:hypothetical protein
MLKRLLGTYVGLLIVCCGGCHTATPESQDSDYPAVRPIWIVEDDPKVTIFDRKDLQRDRKVGKILMIPLYRYYQHGGTTDFLAIAHPFVYEQGKDIERHLSSSAQRNRLSELILWVPGYFPGGLGKIPPWEPKINGKRMIVMELQRCLGPEEKDINAALKELLLGKDFVIGGVVGLAPPPPPYTPAKMSSDSYDALKLVRSVTYAGRYYNHQAAENVHVLWAFDPGTRVVNRLSDDEKNTVRAFFEEVTKATERSPRNQSATTSEKNSSNQPNNHPSPPSNSGQEK